MKTLGQPFCIPARTVWRTPLRTSLSQLGLACCLVCATSLGLPISAFAQSNAQHNGQVALNFVNAELETVVKAVAQATGRNIVVDPRVKGTVNLVTEKPISKDQALLTLSSLLRMQGYALVGGNGFMKVVPEADAKLQGTVTEVAGTSGRRGDQIVTQVFRLNYESANNLVPVLRPLIAPNNTITAYAANNTLVITDYAENLQRIGKIIAAVDAPATGEVDIVPLKHALAVDIATVVNRMMDAQGAAEGGMKTTVMAEPRSNAVLIRASSPARVNQAKSLITKLDQPTARPGNIWVVPLKNAEASKLAQTLRAIVAADSSLAPSASGNTPNTGAAASSGATGTSAAPATGTSGGANGSFGGSGITPSTGGIIQADPSTNSLIITASEPMYRNLREVIERLDARRAQIYVESMIVEVSSEKAAEFGIQWQALLGGGRAQTLVGTNFSSGGNNIASISPTVSFITGNSTTASSTSISAGLNIGLVDKVLGLAALARLMDNQSGVNVLSTPNLLTLDNEEAKITIGRNVPFITGQYAQTGSTATVTPFQTIERKDVGLTLRVRPQISEGGLVKLQIFQEASSIADTSNSAGIITNKRSIESSVLVEDGQTIALGGLLEDSYTDGVEKVPGFGDVPVVGALFRYENKKRSKTNLMVFLRPYVIRSSAQSDSIVADRYDLMRSTAQNTRPNAWYVQGGEPPVVPPLGTPQNPLINLSNGKPAGAAIEATAPAKAPTPTQVTGQ